MTINIKIEDLYIKSKDLYESLRDQKTISSSEALAFSAQLVKLRKLSDTLLKEHVLPSLNEDQFIHMGACRKLIFKSQSKLLKSLDPSILQSCDFHTKVCQVWAHAASEKAPSLDFGKKYAQAFPKDPITLEGLNNYLMDTTLRNLVKAITLKNTTYASQLLKKIPAEAQKAFKQFFFNQFGKQQIPDDEFLQNAIAAAEKTLQIYDIPIVHHSIDQTSFMFLKLLNDNDVYRREFCNHMLKEAKIELCNREEIRDYLFLNAGHPYLDYALFSIQLSSYLKPAFTMLEKGDWMSARTALRNLLDPAASLVVKRFAQIKQMAPSHALLDKVLNESAPDPDLIEALKQTIEACEVELQKKVPTAPEKKDCKFMAVFTIQGSGNQKTSSCEKALGIAYEAMVYALRKIAISSNFFNREEKTVDIPLYHDVSKLFVFLDHVRTKYGFSSTAEYAKKKSSSENHFTTSISDRKTVEEFPIGNCGELTHLAFEYFSRFHKDLKIEMVEIPRHNTYLNHVFIVINRDENSILDKPQTWGEKAVVLDCWSRMVYPASNSATLIENWEGVFLKSGFVQLKPYNFLEQHFELVNQMVLNYGLYTKINGVDLPKLEFNINAFHKARTVEDKMEFARSALEIIDEEGEEVPKATHMLRAQLYFYLHSKLPPLAPSQSNLAPIINSSTMKEEVS